MADDKPDLPSGPNLAETPQPGKIGDLPGISIEGFTSRSASEPRATTFASGVLLAGRFRVIRLIARGGMGEVYVAEDLELREHVALKTVRFERGNRDDSIERFKREIQLARKVTHVNVCRTFDVFRHVSPANDGPATETLFVSMELLPGETLERRIRHAGRFTATSAIPIVVQMAAGLRAAHLAGVIHRDFKSANVILAPSDQSPDALRVVITDFGLAHAEFFAGQSLTGSNDLVGTPAYMAPEQIQGKAITPATDVYALGVVVFEMVTGTLPFVGDTALTTALKRLEAPAPSARSRVPAIETNWDQAIARSLERDPANRFTNVEDFLRALGGDVVALPWRSPKKLARIRTLAAIGVFLLLFAATWYFAMRYRVRVSSTGRPSVAVLGFKNLSGDSGMDLLGDELAENLGSQLDTDKIHFISSARVDDMKQNLGLNEISESLSPATLAKIHDYLGCDVVVLGSYSIAAGQNEKKIAWNIHVVRTSDGESLGTVPETMDEKERFDVARRAGQQVRAKLGVELAAAEVSRLDAVLPANDDALRYFTEGREKLRNFDVLAATSLFQKAVASDPNYAEAHSALAEAWWKLGYEGKARDEAKQAFDLSAGLSKETGELVQARYYEMTNNWPEASQRYSALLTFYPENPEYGLMLAGSQISGGRPEEALATLSRIRTSSLTLGAQAQVDLQTADAQALRANFEEQLKAATAAAEKAEKVGGKLLLARARVSQCQAMLGLGTMDQAQAICEDAKRLNQDAGDQLGTARAINDIATAYKNQGSPDKARPLYEQALQISRNIGDKLDEAGALTNLGNIMLGNGDFAGAEKTYRKSIEVSLERGDDAELALAKSDLAAALIAQGHRTEAKDLWESSVKLAHDSGAKDTEARALNNLCMMIYFNAGNLPKAHETCGASLLIRQTAPLSDADIARSLVNTGAVLFAHGDVNGAKQNYDKALEYQQHKQLKSDEAYTQIELASLALEDGRPLDAAKLAESAATELSKESDPSGEASARTGLAEALLDSGQAADARAQYEIASQLSQKVGDAELQIDVDIIGGKIEARAGKFNRAIQLLQTAKGNARSAGLVGAEFEATLALGEAQIAAGHTEAGRSLLRNLAQQAKAKGFNLIAGKAEKNI
jgi:serine/threonine protein kinase/tetratricopeptide (TPR) repeat protein